MAKKWAEVASNPEFVAMPYETKLEVRQEYFDNVVAPNIPEDLRTVERLKFEDYAAIETPTTGASGAFGASVDRLQAGAQTLMGDHEAAEANIKESKKYEASSYKDVRGPLDLLSYVGENMAGAVPYLAAPVAAIGAGVAGAPAAVPLAIGALGAMAYGSLEGGATYAEQETKSVPRAVAVGAFSAALERIPGLQGKSGVLLNSPLLTNIVRKGLEEVITTTGQVAVEGMVGHNRSFTETMSNLDEALAGSMAARSGYSAATTAANNVPAIPEKKRAASTFIWGSKDEDGNRTQTYHTTTKEGMDNVKFDDASDLAAVDPTNGVKDAQKVWASRELQNSAEAAKKLQDRGAELSPVALDIDASTADGKVVNIAKEFEIGTAADKAGRILASKFKMPLFGEMVDPKKGYETTKLAYEGFKKDFDVELKRGIEGLNLDREITVDILRDIQNYVTGRKPKTDFETKQFILQSPNKLEIFDSITQIKRMRQMTENMKPKGDHGALGGIGGIGIEALATGGLPVFTTIGGAVGSTLSKVINDSQKNKMRSIIDGKGTPESKLKALLNALEGVEFEASGINRAGFADGLEEEVKAKVKPDMGTLELVK